MTVAEMVILLQGLDQNATCYVFGDSNAELSGTERVTRVLSMDWGPQPVVIFDSYIDSNDQ